MYERLGLCSCHSLLWGVHDPLHLVQHARQEGAKVVSIADTNLHGVHEFLEASRTCSIRPIIGARLDVGPKPLLLFAKDRTGFGNLCTLLSSHGSGRPDPIEFLRSNSQGLVAVTTNPQILGHLQGIVPHVFAGVTKDDVGSIPTSRRLGIPPALLDLSLFTKQSDAKIHAVLRAIALGKTMGTLQSSDVHGQEALLPSASAWEQFCASWPEAAEGSREIARLCTLDSVFDGFVFPSYHHEEKETCKELLRNRVLAGAEARYGELSDAILGRIDYEMDIIDAKGFSPYFLIMHDIISMASRTCGRGSAAASIVSYSLGITNVDPIAHNLYFERFLNPSRIDPPDIDVDFAWDERDGILHKVMQMFGSDRCARVANHNRFRGRSAIREVAKAFGMSDGDISRRLGSASPDEDPLWKEIMSIASDIVGLPRSISMHCGGMVATAGPINRYCPIGTSVDGYPLLAWEKEGTEAAGLVKIDLLGNRSLAVIRDALESLSRQGIIIDPMLWKPQEDQQTIEALAKGDSMGVFYIESPAMRQLQQKTGKGDFDHIVIHSSIIRPAANKFINEYVRRLKGGPWEPLHPRLKRILDETYGILCYQEDVSKAAIALAGFDESEADSLRKIIAKKAGGEKLSRYEHKFREGCRKQGVDSDTADQVWTMMCSFDGYSFCKPHSASYAMVSFQSAYLRVHHPAPFMAAVLSNQGGYYRAQAYVSEARRMGLLISGPDVNESNWQYEGIGATITVGLMAIAHLQRGIADAIVDERTAHGSYASPADLARRIRLSREDAVALAASGACDSLAPRCRRDSIARSLLSTETIGEITGRQSENRRLFDPESMGSCVGQQRQLPVMTTIKSLATTTPVRHTDAELAREFEYLGFLRTQHPLALFIRETASVRRIRACELYKYTGCHVTLIGWPVTSKAVWTKDGRDMQFVSFEDETALYETILFPDVHDRYNRMLASNHPLVVSGTACNDQGALHVEITCLQSLPAYAPKIQGMKTI